ncbi:MAG: hypothetical protein JJD92_14520 [Frankiaceae bacterium]|nr:hypothetical protein [Frankiaceae bacterium]
MKIGRQNDAQPPLGSVIPLEAMAVQRNELVAAYDRYRSVSGGAAPDLLSTADMLHARVELIRALCADGWDAPPAVLERLQQDEAMLRPRLLVAS